MNRNGTENEMRPGRDGALSPPFGGVWSPGLNWLAIGIPPVYERRMRSLLFVLAAGTIVLSGCSDRRYQAESQVKAGVALMQQGDLDGATDDFDRALELDPQNADAYYYRGVVAGRLESWDKAVADLTKAIGLNSQYADAYFWRGAARQQQGDLNGALADFNQIITLKPQFARPYLDRGLVKSGMSNWDDALADFNHCLKLDPRDPIAYYYRGVLEHRQGDLDKALADYTRAISIKLVRTNRFYAQVFERRGVLKLDRCDLDGALADLNQSVELLPRNAGSRVDRGVVNYLRHDPQAAIADFEEAAELRFDHREYPRIFIWLARAEQADQRAAADRELDEYFSTHDNGTNDWPFLVGHFLTGRLSQADLLKAADSPDAAADNSETRQQRHCEAYFYVGTSHLLAGDRPAAKSFFQRCVATDVKTFYEFRMARVRLAAMQKE